MKSCTCGAISLVFIPCTGEKCKQCKLDGHEEQQYCALCSTFTCTCYGEKK